MVVRLLAAVAMAVAPQLTHVTVYTSGQDGYSTYRIPAIETALDGTLLAFAEARRYNAADPGMEQNEIDLVLKRSTDGGRTWSAMQVIEHAGERWSAANAATLVDRKTRRIWVLYLRCRPGRDTDTSRAGTDDTQTVARWSSDSGLTWSPPMDLTSVARDLADPGWTCSVIGPGGAVQLRTGRLLAAAWKARPYVPFALLSDDHGRTWRRGHAVPGAEGGNECQVVERRDGSIAMDIRQNGGAHRWLAVSYDGGETWSTPQPSQVTTPVACAVERLTSRGGRDAGLIVWTGPRGPGRRTLVMRSSRDGGTSFGDERVIADEPAAYSDLAPLRDGGLGVLWERADYRYIAFTRLAPDFIAGR